MKVYVKKLRLKQWVKEFLMVNLIFAIMLTSVVCFKERIRQINNGELELVYQYGGDV